MPYKSDAQRRWAHTDAGKKSLGGPAKVKEWDAASKGADLPDRKKPVVIRKIKPKTTRADVVVPARMG